MTSGTMTLSDFVNALVAIKEGFSSASDSAVKKAARDTMYDFRSKVVKMHGKYQEGAGDYPDWEELAPSTIRKRTKAGYTPDDPLLASGQMVEAWEIEEGSNSITLENDTPYAGFNEEGTEHTPQRSTVGLAMARYEDQMRRKFESRLRFYMRSKTGRI